MLTTIHLHGSLGKKFGKEHQYACANMFQVMQHLKRKLGQKFTDIITEGNWHVTDGAFKKGNDRGADDLDQPLTNKEVHIAPVVSGRSAALRIVIGIVLIVVGTFVPGMQWAVQVGIALVVGGVTELLFAPKIAMGTSDLEASKLFNSAQNISTQGGAKPRGYGTIANCSSVIVNSNFSSDKVLT